MLGECEEELAVKIEERLFSNDAFYEELQRIKASLIEREVRGNLSPTLSLLLTQQALRSPTLQGEIEHARMLYRQSLELQQRKSTSSFFFSLFQRIRVSLSLQVMAACLLLTSTFFLVRAFLIHPSLQRGVASGQHPGAINPEPIGSVDKPTAIFFLPATVLRGGANAPSLSIPNAQGPVELQIEVRSDLPCCWSAIVLHGTDRIFAQQNLESKSVSGLRYLSLSLPSGTLKSGDYSVQLTLADPSTNAAAPLSFSRNFKVTYASPK